MKKLKLTLLLLFIVSITYSQQSKPEDKSSGLFEIQFGLVGYSYFNVAAPSIQFNLATPLSKYMSFGVLLNGYVTTKSATKTDAIGNDQFYNPKGVRAGFMLRASTTPDITHFYGELIGTAGRAFNTGVVLDPAKSKATEFMAGGNIGVNFLTKKNYFFGIYTGLSIGQLDFDDQLKKQKIARFQFGLTYHIKA